MTETRRFELARDGEVYVSIPLEITGTLTQPPPPARHPEDSTVGGFSLSTIIRDSVATTISPDRATDYIIMTSQKPFYYHIAQEIATTPPAGVGDTTSTLPQDTLIHLRRFIFSYDSVPTDTKAAPTMYDIPDRQYNIDGDGVGIIEGDAFEKDEEVDLWMITTGRAYAVAVPIPIVSVENTSSKSLFIATVGEQPIQITTGREVE